MKNFPRCKNVKFTTNVSEFEHKTTTGTRKVKVEFQTHTNFVVYRQHNGWNCQSIMNNELRLLNEKLAREDRKICLAIDFAPAHLIANQKIPNLTNIKLVYIGRGLTDKLQPLDSAFIACLKNVYKRWLNLEIFNSEQMPSKFDKVKKNSEIAYSMRPEIGKYCWDATIFKGPEEAEEPEEMVNSRAEIREESMLKVTAGFDQMHVEDDVEGIEEEEYIILEEVPDVQIIDEVPDVQERAGKSKVQSKITSFFTAK